MDCTSELHLANSAAFYDIHRKTVTDDEDRMTESDNTGLAEAKGQVPDSTNRGQTSQKAICSEGNCSVQTCAFRCC